MNPDKQDMHLWVDGVRLKVVSRGKNARDGETIHIKDAIKALEAGGKGPLDFKLPDSDDVITVYRVSPDTLTYGRKGRKQDPTDMFGRPGALAELAVLSAFANKKLSKENQWLWERAIQTAFDAGHADRVLDIMSKRLAQATAVNPAPEVAAAFEQAALVNLTQCLEPSFLLDPHMDDTLPYVEKDAFVEVTKWAADLVQRYPWLNPDQMERFTVFPSLGGPAPSNLRALSALVQELGTSGPSQMGWLANIGSDFYNTPGEDLEAVLTLWSRMTVSGRAMSLSDIPAWVLTENEPDPDGVYRFTSVARAITSGGTDEFILHGPNRRPKRLDGYNSLNLWRGLPEDVTITPEMFEKLDLASRLPVRNPVAAAINGGTGLYGVGEVEHDPNNPVEEWGMFGVFTPLWSGAPMTKPELEQAVTAFDNSGPFSMHLRSTSQTVDRVTLEALIAVSNHVFETQGDSLSVLTARSKEAEDYLHPWRSVQPVTSSLDEVVDLFITDPAAQKVVVDYPQLVTMTMFGFPSMDPEDAGFFSARVPTIVERLASEGVTAREHRDLLADGPLLMTQGTVYAQDDLRRATVKAAQSWDATAWNEALTTYVDAGMNDEERERFGALSDSAQSVDGRAAILRALHTKVDSGELSISDIERLGPQALTTTSDCESVDAAIAAVLCCGRRLGA